MAARMVGIVVLLAAGVVARPTEAQPVGTHPVMGAEERSSSGAVEGIVGHAVFADDSAIHHSVFGVAAPIRLSPRVSVGPELLRMKGPGDDRDWVVAGVVWFDIIGPVGGHPRRVVPLLLAGGGLFAHNDRFGTTSEGYVGGGGGVRVHVTDRVYVAPEVQVAWELHVRTIARIGYAWPAGPGR